MAAPDAADAWQSVPRVRPPRSLFDSPAPARGGGDVDAAFATPPPRRRRAQPPGSARSRMHFMPALPDYEPTVAHPACEACGAAPGEGLCRGCTFFLCRACCLGAAQAGRLCAECGLACEACVRTTATRRALASRARGVAAGTSMQCRGCAAALASPTRAASAPRGRTPRTGEERTPGAAAAPELASCGGGGRSSRRRASPALLAPKTREPAPAPKRRRG